MKVTLLGFTVPRAVLDEINRHDPVMPNQTYRFAWSLVGALRSNGAEVRLLSTAPVSDYPDNPHAWWRRQHFDVGGVAGVLMPFVNVLVLKHLTRFLSCWLVGTRELRRFRPDWLVVHGVHSPFLWFAVLVGPRVGSRVAVVVTDPPGVVRAEESRLRSLLKRMDIAVVTRALRRAAGVVVLAEPLARDFAPGVPYVVVEGLFDPGALPPGPRGAVRDDLTVVFAGGLVESYGVRHLVEAFRSLARTDVRLDLYGRGPLETWLAEQTREDPRVSPVRLLAPEELPDVYARATVLVQPRQPDQDFVPYSFPSKLIEYLASGAVVVSTRLPSIPADYDPFVVWTEGDRDSLAATLERVLAWPAQTRAEFGSDAAGFIRTSRGIATQGQRIVEFLNALGSPPRDG